MANFIDDELYPDNNSHTTAHPMRWRLNPTTGVAEEVAVSSLTDLKCYISLTKNAASDADAVHAALVVTMAEILSTAAYEGTFSGSAKRSHLIAQPDGTKLYVHWQSASAGYHEWAEVTWRPDGRPASLV